MICRFVFSGSGGQGVITAAIIMAEAAVYHGGLNAVQTQSYGPEARGGAARADVILSSEEIQYPKVDRPNILICLSNLAYSKYTWLVRPGGVVFIDPHIIKTRRTADARQVELPLYENCLEALGTTLPMNICLLGCLSRLVGLVTPEALEKVIENRFSGKNAEMNIKALHLGVDLVTRLPEMPPIQFL
ncbi:MAG: 2-oxoacid:acceptor oxidoreductase family protein [Spirochaetales bacterium]|nr:2-oxoacid:acceptor oxidoreductase family protein [Spirochaetales bacterium]